jgi:hypothetical protein
MKLVESFALLDASIAEMKAKLNEYTVHTDGRINAAQGAAVSAAQGAAAAMPQSEIITLNGMHRELEVLKGLSANTATKAEVAHLERRANFTDVQLAGTNERMTIIAAQITLEAVGASSGAGKIEEVPAIGATDVDPASAPHGSMTATGGTAGKIPCCGSGVEHATLIRLLTVRVQSLEATRAAAAAGDDRQPFMPHLRRDAQAFVPGGAGYSGTTFDAPPGIDGHGSFNPQAPMSADNGFTGTTQIGMLTGDKYGERPLYDDKAAERPEFQFDGVHKGPDWKSRMGNIPGIHVPDDA